MAKYARKMAAKLAARIEQYEKMKKASKQGGTEYTKPGSKNMRKS